MATRTIPMTDALHAYLLSTTVHLMDVQKRLRQETAAMPNGGMQISPEQGEFMAFLVKALGVKKALEVGVFTGYSALTVAMALPADGHLTACDVSEPFTTVARRYWREAGVAEKIDLRLGPAAGTLERLLAEGGEGGFDFAFIDADKPSYDVYYEAALKLVRPGGVLALDNMLQNGRVADDNAIDDATIAIRALNEKIAGDSRVVSCLVPIGDGLTLVLKK